MSAHGNESLAVHGEDSEEWRKGSGAGSGGG